MDAADEWHKSNDNTETDMRSAMFMHRGLPLSHTKAASAEGKERASGLHTRKMSNAYRLEHKNVSAMLVESSAVFHGAAVVAPSAVCFLHNGSNIEL